MARQVTWADVQSSADALAEHNKLAHYAATTLRAALYDVACATAIDMTAVKAAGEAWGRAVALVVTDIRNIECTRVAAWADGIAGRTHAQDMMDSLERVCNDGVHCLTSDCDAVLSVLRGIDMGLLSDDDSELVDLAVKRGFDATDKMMLDHKRWSMSMLPIDFYHEQRDELVDYYTEEGRDEMKAIQTIMMGCKEANEALRASQKAVSSKTGTGTAKKQ